MSTCERCGTKNLLGYEMVNLCKPCATGNTVGTQPTDAQQLKDEISGVLDSMQYRVTNGIDAKILQFYINELRQKLSAV